ncbi:DUF3080 family protein [Shewanella halotolerans]|uniref:DUF3080 family protein n=1 Tax=Shewanella halotolerans TaxID=2864204 RepID=UPI001C657F7E|nr:DUF3080 family protein [Shewanella halotolerans]QYJ89532.1 DUF3080 domain-containing protein [Shewanella halotolerans]
MPQTHVRLTTKGLLMLCFLLCLLLWLPGCQRAKDVDYLWQNYSQRLAHVIDQPYSPPEFKPMQLGKADRQEQASLTISILDTLSLGHCPLGRLIADHNSTLGKVAPPSQQLIYQISFIQLAPACIDTLDEGELKNKLTQALQQKQAHAMSYFNRVLTRDKSFTKSLFIGYDSLVLDEMRAGRFELESAIGQLLSIKDHIKQRQWQQIDTAQIEPALALMAHQTLLQRYLRSLAYSQAQLIALNDYLQLHSASVACRPNHANRKQEILQNVFHKYYLAQTQAYLSQLNQLHYRLSEPLLALFAGSNHQAFIEHYFGEQPGALPEQLKSQMRRHVKWWQVFRESCNIAPPSSST